MSADHPTALESRDGGRHRAELIRLTRRRDEMSIEIDGVVFPLFTAAGGWHVDVRRGHMPGVTVTLVARRVEVVDEI